MKSAGRRQAVADMKRGIILDAARRIFETEGLDGASLRAIAAEAGYTPAALYFHFDSKEAIYGEVLRESLNRLSDAVRRSLAGARTEKQRLKKAAMGFFKFYAENPRDLDLGFYLFRGGMKPKGLGKVRDEELNKTLGGALAPISETAERMGVSAKHAELLVVDIFAHATGLLLLAHTGRIRMFGASAARQMENYVDQQIARIGKG